MFEDKELDALFSEIGEIVIANNYMGVDFIREDELTSADAGRGWFLTSLGVIQARICSEEFRAKADKMQSDSGELTTAIADIIASICGVIPPFTVSRLIVKVGLDKVCSFPRAPQPTSDKGADE